MKTNIFICLLIGLLFSGCKKESETVPSQNLPVVNQSIPDGKLVSNVVDAKIGDFVIDLTGKKYKKITNEKINSDGIKTSDVWERVGDKRSWYTPTLSSKMDKNSSPMFNSLFRNSGEQYPTF